MWDSYIGRQIRRANRNLLLVNGLLVAVVLVAAALGSRYLYNFCFGPFPVDIASLVEVRQPGNVWRYYVTVRSSQGGNVGRHKETRVNKTTNAVVSEQITAEYLALVATERPLRLLLVKAPSGGAGTEFSGALEPVPPDVARQIMAPAEAREVAEVGQPHLRASFVRGTMLDAVGFRTPGYWGLGIGGPLLLFGLWNVARAAGRWANPERHPLIGRLARHGPPAEVAAAIAQEVARDAGAGSTRRTVLTRSWLFEPSLFGLNMVSLHEVLWVYKKVTKHSTNGIPTGKSYAAVICQRNGGVLELAGKEAGTDQLLQRILGNVPWVLAGFAPELAGLWRKQRAELAAIVDERRRIIQETPSAIPQPEQHP